MQKVIEWLTSGGWDAILTTTWMAVTLLATIATKFMNGPAQDKTMSIADMIKRGIRVVGGGQFKDEPGNWSVPLASGDSKVRIVEVKTKSLVPPANT